MMGRMDDPVAGIPADRLAEFEAASLPSVSVKYADRSL